MNSFREWAGRIGAMFSRRRDDAEFDDELRGHLELLTEENVRRGMPADKARRQARIRLGNATQIRETHRQLTGLPFLETLMQDIRYALRMLRKSPGFTAVAVLTLALGIGANTAIFTLLDGLVLRTLPVPHPEQLVHVGVHSPTESEGSASLPMFEEIERDQNVFSGMFAWWGDGVFNVETEGKLSRADVWAVTGNLYSDLGARPEIGRLIEPSDVDLNAPAAERVAVLGYDFWKRNYGGATGVIGKTIKVEGAAFTIIGVTRAGFEGMDADGGPGVTVPLTAEPLIAGYTDIQKHLQRRDVLWLDTAGRLKPGTTLGQARAELESQWPSIRNATRPTGTAAQQEYFNQLVMSVEPDATGYSFVRGRFAKPVYVLLGISGVVLLLACVNLASLLLSRAAARRKEFGVRVALGAKRGRLARQLLTESIMISVAGALAGLVFASWGSHALAAFILGQIYVIPSSLNLSPDPKILFFTAGIAILTGTLFGLAPAWGATREDPNFALREGARTVASGTGRMGKGLIVTQIALSVVLLAGASLFIRTLEKLRSAQPGFQIRDVTEFNLFVKPNAFKDADRTSYFRELTERVSSLPGVSSAGVERVSVGSLFEWKEKIHVHGANRAEFESDCEMAMPGFFETEGVRLLKGRLFNWSDGPKAAQVALVSQDFASKVFSKGLAIGQHIDVRSDPKWQDIQIVGIVGNASLYDIRKPPQPTVYLPTLQYGDYADDDALLVRSKVPSAAIAPSVRQVIDELGRHTAMAVRPLTASIDRSILKERITAMLSAFFGALALLIAGIGLFGLMAYSVTERRRELGIRLALGAQRGEVMRMILREALAVTIIGLAVGLPCALGAARIIAHMLFGVTTYDPVTLAVVSGTLVAVALMACYVPARRAMKVDPMVALRYE